MLARWLAKLQQFHFDIIHRPGAQHGNADGLSRCPQCERGTCAPNTDSNPSDPEQPYATSCIGSSLDSELIPLESGETCMCNELGVIWPVPHEILSVITRSTIIT